ncbi:hypothetical protein X964_00270 [Acinetobacter baumannii MDR_MMC4]|nr:hypothetical protein X964_00270 [Acinetobacter baumannii MDR_MMC4]
MNNLITAAEAFAALQKVKLFFVVLLETCWTFLT